jgi:cytosine/creatinine deaminase
MTTPHADLVFRGAHLEDSPAPVDIAIANGRIAAMEPSYPGAGAVEIDASRLMASPPFIDAHHHLDCAFLFEPVNRSGTLAEAIEINARIKTGRSPQEVYAKACQALELALFNGTGWIRSHVDIDPVSGLDLLAPVVEAKERYRGLVDVQIVAFPQLGLIDDPRSAGLMREAMREGADVVGGMPHHERSRADAARHIEICFDIAEEFDAAVDMHVDETDDPNSRTLELLAEATIRHGYQSRVTAGHCCALAAYDDKYARRVIEKVAEARLNVVTNPLVNLYLQGRDDRQPVRRGITRVKELLEAGVNVACGMDDVRNLFFPYGRMDMLEVAMFTSITAHLTTPEGIQTCFDMPRHRAARVLGLDNYGLAPGLPADLVFFASADAQEALQAQPPRRHVLRRGRIVATSRLEQTRVEGRLER